MESVFLWKVRESRVCSEVHPANHCIEVKVQLREERGLGMESCGQRTESWPVLPCLGRRSSARLTEADRRLCASSS